MDPATDEVDGLTPLGQREPLPDYLRSAWNRRSFAVALPVGDLRSQTNQTSLGQLWHLLNPALMVAVYYLIFGVILEADRGVDNYLGFLVVGVLFFQLTQRVLMDASGVIPRNQGLIRTLQFPRVLLPVASVVGQTVAFAPALLVLVATLLLTGETPSLKWLALVPVLAAQALLNLGAALLLARVGDSIRDISQVLPHLFRVLFYMSGVLFAVDVFVEDETLQNLFALNPVYDVVTLARWSVVDMSASWLEVVALVAWAMILLVWGLTIFRRAEHRLGA